jgi:cell division protein FtsQ
MPERERKEYSGYYPDMAPQGSSEGGEGVESRYEPAAAHNGKAKVFIFIVVLAGLASLAFYSMRWKKEVVVRDIVVEGVSSAVAKEFSTGMLVYKGRNLQELDPADLKARVMQFPYVRDAVISKELNGIVRIRVLERVPLALTVMDGNIMAVDTEGFLLPGKKEFSAQVPKLLTVSGISRLKAGGNGLQRLDRRDIEVLRQFLDALSRTNYARLLIRELHLQGNNMTYFIAVQAPTRFIVGNDGNFKEKLKKFEIFWQKVVSKKGFGSYESVDLRFTDRIFTIDVVSPQATQAGPQL